MILTIISILLGLVLLFLIFRNKRPKYNDMTSKPKYQDSELKRDIIEYPTYTKEIQHKPIKSKRKKK